MVRYIEDIYSDYLYDCYIANKRLSPEDWQYYGRENHHIEIPNRDGGELTSLNSQHLTTYQHWVAGVMQSEMLQKKCFAYIPRGALPQWLEDVRVKWSAACCRDSGLKGDRSGKRAAGLAAAKSGHLDRIRTLRDPNKLVSNGITNLTNAQAYWKSLPAEEISRKRALAAGARPFILVTPDGAKIEYLIQRQAERDFNIGNLSAVLHGKKRHTKGFTAYYLG